MWSTRRLASDTSAENGSFGASQRAPQLASAISTSSVTPLATISQANSFSGCSLLLLMPSAGSRFSSVGPRGSSLMAGLVRSAVPKASTSTEGVCEPATWVV